MILAFFIPIMKKRFKKIYVEITNVCNLSCGFCPKTTRVKEFMSLELFTRVIEESKDLCDEITMHVMGEPLLHKEFKRFVELCEEKEIRINLTTNATLIDKHFDTLLNKTIRRVNFSFQDFKSNNLNENEVLKNIFKFTKLANGKREDMIIIYRLWNLDNENNNDNEKIIKKIEEEFDCNILNQDFKISEKVVGQTYIHYDYEFVWPSESKENRVNGYCHGLSTHIAILVDGSVIPCCLDNEGKINLGNIKENSLSEILESKKAKDMYTGFKGRKLVDELCKQCSYIKRFDLKK